ncbi:hypothetical protein EZS27_042662, partial [termite gut metagenome]
EDDIKQIFPEASVARMDLDTTRTRKAYEKIIVDFEQGRTDILVGTQMISKGLDFDRVSIVGILNADTMLNYPDFVFIASQENFSLSRNLLNKLKINFLLRVPATGLITNSIFFLLSLISYWKFVFLLYGTKLHKYFENLFRYLPIDFS